MEVVKKEFGLPTLDKKNDLHMVVWEPQGGVKAILQICHGMTEYVERYEELAQFLAQRGILVIGNDHLGHGQTAKKKEDYGYFAAGTPSKIVVDNLYMITRKIQTEYPDVPYVVLGHSMGSFLIRRYIMMYGEHVDGCLILGTGKQSWSTVISGKFMVRLLTLFQGDHHYSKLMRKLSTGDFNSHFEGKPGNWCTKDEDLIKSFENDPYCDFIFSLNGYQLLLDTVGYIQKKQNILKIPKNLPLQFMSGEEDPVGDFGAGVEEIFHEYQDAGIGQVTMKLYPGDRHELYHETDRQTVFEEIYQWVSARKQIRR